MTEKDQVRVEIIGKLVEGGDLNRALSLIQTMRAEGVERPELGMYQGIIIGRQGMIEDAHRLLATARDEMPRNAEVERARCVLFADDNQLDQAESACLRATELDDQDAAAWNNLGFIYLAREKHADSRAALQQAVDLDATKPRYRNNLAYAQAAAGDDRAALRTFLTTGTPADAHYNVGTAFERAGDAETAKSYYERALKYDAQHRPADDALARLQAEPAPLPSTEEP